MTPPKEHNNGLVTSPEETEMYEVPDKEFKRIVFKKLICTTRKQS